MSDDGGTDLTTELMQYEDMREARDY